MKSRSATRLVCGVCMVALASTAFPDGIEDLAPTVVFLRQGSVRTTVVEGETRELWLKEPGTNVFKPFLEFKTGSGILLTYSNAPYIVTAQHVAEQLTPSANLFISGTADNAVEIPFAAIIPPTNALPWVVHPEADVAVLPVTPRSPVVVKMLAKHFLPSEVLSPQQSPPPRHTSVTTLGFPLGLGVAGKFSPISKVSRPASGLITLPRFDTKRPAIFFLLEDPSVGGFSGAPVVQPAGAFMSPGTLGYKKFPTVFGLVHGTISDNTGGKMGAVTPSTLVLEALALAHDRLDHHGAQQPPERDK